AALDVQLREGGCLAEGDASLDRGRVDDDSLLHVSWPSTGGPGLHHPERTSVRRERRPRISRIRGAARHGVEASREPTRVARSSCWRTLSNGRRKSKTFNRVLTFPGTHL